MLLFLWQVTFSNRFSAKDQFVIRNVPVEQQASFQYVFSRTPALATFLEQVTPHTVVCSIGLEDLIDTVLQPQSAEKQTVYDILKDFILFCSFGDETDPLEREGTPVPSHQHLVSDRVCVVISTISCAVS
jgi:hypothetical protein